METNDGAIKQLDTIQNYPSDNCVPYDIKWSQPRVGNGAFGDVFRASRGGRIYAIKRLSTEEAKRKEYAVREIENLQKCENRNILKLVDVYKCEEHQNQIFLVTLPFAPQGDLWTFFTRLGESDIQKRWPWFQTRSTETSEALLGLLNGCIDGLDYIHSQGLKHKDIKPENILLHSDPSDDGYPIPVIIDFGMSKSADKEQLPNSPTTFNSTYVYLAPEQLHRHRNLPESDVFALGICFAMILGVASEYGTGLAKVTNPSQNEDCQYASHINETRIALLALKTAPGINPTIWSRILNDISYHMLVPIPENRATSSQVKCLADNNWQNPCESPRREPNPYDPISQWEERNNRVLASIPYPVTQSPSPIQSPTAVFSSTAAKNILSKLRIDCGDPTCDQFPYVPSSPFRLPSNLSNALRNWLRQDGPQTLWVQGPLNSYWAPQLSRTLYEGLKSVPNILVLTYSCTCSSGLEPSDAMKSELFLKLLKSLIVQIISQLPNGIEAAAPEMDELELLMGPNALPSILVKFLSELLPIIPTPCIILIDGFDVLDYSRSESLDDYLKELVMILAKSAVPAIHANSKTSERGGLVKTLLTTRGSIRLLNFVPRGGISMDEFDASSAEGMGFESVDSIISERFP
jgi:serine/threonine protein kinase